MYNDRMKLLCIILNVFFLFSCSQLVKVEKAKDPGPFAKKDLKFEVIELSILNGFIKKVIIPLEREIKVEDIFCNNKRIGFDRVDEGVRIYLSAPYKFKNKSFECSLRAKNYSPKKIIIVHIKKHKYQEEFLKVTKKHVDLSPQNLKRWQNEVKQLEQVYKASILKRALFTTHFSRPLKSHVTSSYGKRRVFNNKKDSWHSGIDFRARVPTKIPSSNRGKVAFVGDLFFNGKTVIIDHGLGIFTMYCHLSKMTSQVGEIVPKGAIIGVSGNTGRSSAPHLHWGVRVFGNWVNGFSLLKEDSIK